MQSVHIPGPNISQNCLEKSPFSSLNARSQKWLDVLNVTRGRSFILRSALSARSVYFCRTNPSLFLGVTYALWSVASSPLIQFCFLTSSSSFSLMFFSFSVSFIVTTLYSSFCDCAVISCSRSRAPVLEFLLRDFADRFCDIAEAKILSLACLGGHETTGLELVTAFCITYMGWSFEASRRTVQSNLISFLLALDCFRVAFLL